MEQESFGDEQLLPDENLSSRTPEGLQKELTQLNIQIGVHEPVLVSAMERTTMMIDIFVQLGERKRLIIKELASLPESEVKDPPEES